MKKITHFTFIFVTLALPLLTFAATKQVRLKWVQTSTPQATQTQLTFKNEAIAIALDNTEVGRHENQLQLVGSPQTIAKINQCIQDSQAIGPRGRLSLEYSIRAADATKISRAKTNAPLKLRLPENVYCDRQVGYNKLISDSFTVQRAPASEKSILKAQIDKRLNSSCQRQGGVLRSVQAIQSHLAHNSINTYRVSADIVCFFK